MLVGPITLQIDAHKAEQLDCRLRQRCRMEDLISGALLVLALER
jgi:hypothetical protein